MISQIRQVRAEAARVFIVHPDSGSDLAHVGEPLAGVANECQTIGFRMSCIHPGKPWPKIETIAIDQREMLTSIPLFEKPQFETIPEMRGEHALWYPGQEIPKADTRQVAIQLSFIGLQRRSNCPAS